MTEIGRYAEIATIVFAVASLTFLGLLSYHYYLNIYYGTYEHQDPTVIKVIGKQYVWLFQYPNGTTVPDKLVLQAGKPYEILVTSDDVIHALYFVNLGYKLEAIPGYTYHMYIELNQPGTYPIYCAEFCGPGHYTMKAILIVTPSNSSG